MIGGYSGNAVQNGAYGATIAGGCRSGYANMVTDDLGVVGGGLHNQAGVASTVAGGQNNTAGGASTAAGGFGNSAGGDSSFAGGEYNTASGTGATVARGFNNRAGGNFSFAAGKNATATHDGSFVWGGGSGNSLSSYGANTVSFGATGGATFVTGFDSSGNPSAGVTVYGGGGTWASLSDRKAKRNFRPIDRQALLARLARIPITRWSYKTQAPSIRHLGPTAQAFHRAFRLGEDRRHIDTIDPEGVLAAIEGLYRQNQALARQNRRLGARLASLERAVAATKK